MEVKELLNKIRCQTESIEEEANEWCKNLSNYANNHKKKPVGKHNNILANHMHQFVQLCNREDIKSIERRNHEQIKKINEIEDEQADLEKKIAELEVNKEKLKRNDELAKRTDKLNNCKVLLKCVKSIFPVGFDYTSKNVTGFMYNKEAQSYCAFDLPPDDSAGNTKQAWRHLEKLFPK